MHLLATITEESRRVFEFAGMPAGWLRLLGLLLLVGLGYGVIWLYRREARSGAGPRLRMALAALRLGVLLMLVVVWLQPVIATYTVRTVSASVAVLVDVSASMSIVDPAEDAEAVGDQPTSRMDAVATLLTNADHDWLRRLQRRNAVAFYTFGEAATLQRMKWQDAAAPAPGQALAGSAAAATSSAPVTAELRDVLRPSQAHTDIGRAVGSVLADLGDRPIAGVVIVTDGGINQGLGIDDIAAQARRSKAPLHTIGVGAPHEPANVRIESFTAPSSGPLGDPLELRATVSAAGIAPTEFQVELTVERFAVDRADAASPAADREKPLSTSRVVLGGDGPAETVRFVVNPDAAGQLLYRVRVSPLAGEAIVFDNTREAPVFVLDEKLRVLIVAGRPSNDYRFVSKLLERDRTVDLSCWLQSADAEAVRDGDTVITELPRRPEELFGYDAILLMDPNPRDMDSSWAITCRRFVDEFGGGLLLAAGPLFTTRFLNDERLDELVSMLPVAPDLDADVRLSELGAYRTRPDRIEIPDDVRTHALLAFHPDAATNASIWAALPGAWWHLPVQHAKPLAAVLLRVDGRPGRSASAQPLLAVSPFGGGRTAYLGFDSTWRWRATAEPQFDRFWVQLVRYLTQARRQGFSRRGTIVVDRETVNVGEYVKVEARVLDEQFAPWHAPDVATDVQIAGGDSRAVTLTAIPDREGWYAGRVPLDQPGIAAIRVPLPGAASATAPAERTALVKHVHVQRSDAEFRTLRLQEDKLVQLARLTNGTYRRLANAAGLPELIESGTQVKPPIPGPQRSLWDRAWVLSLIALALGVEWLVRRRNHLL